MDLAHQPALHLGKLEVRPPTREVVHPGGREIVEPRVMAVLVVLAQANGAVVTRDELTEACWEGRVVSDDAINRVISRIRKIADLTSGRDFTLETITKIGYRLLVAGDSVIAPAPPIAPTSASGPPPARAIPRRMLLAAGAAAIAGTGGAIVWRLIQPAGPPDRAAELYRRAVEIGPTDEAKAAAQSISFLREAVDLAPNYAEAWAALALAYGYSFTTTPPEKHALLADRARDAANRALAIQPGNADALAALTLLLTPYQHWRETETAYREALARKPSLAPLDCVLGDLLVSTGRIAEGIPHAEKAVARTPLIARRHYELAIAYWYAGRLEDADRVLKKAADLWPLEISLWFGRLYQQMYGGNLRGAIAMLADHANRPPGIPDSDFALVEAVANALQSNKPADRTSAIAVNLAAAPNGLGYARNAVIFAAALGDFDAAVTAADAYYFDRPFPVAATYFSRAQGEYLGVRSRETAFLFSPPLAAFRADPRFEKIAAEIGLEAFWRATNVTPDYRRPTNG